jgi:hypothetical protein
MVLTKATVITWATLQDQDGVAALNEDRMDFIANAVASNKTDGMYDLISDVVTKRYWLDQSAADEYKQFILTETTTLGITIPNVEIIDNV